MKGLGGLPSQYSLSPKRMQPRSSRRWLDAPVMSVQAGQVQVKPNC